MKIRKRNRTGGQILALLMSCCLLSGFFPGTVTAADNTDEEALVLDKRVDETEDGFKLTLESYATGSDGTITLDPVPLDIVLVVDESASMAERIVDGCNDPEKDVQVTLKGHLLESNNNFSEDQLEQVLFVGHKVFADDLDTNKVYEVVFPETNSITAATRNIYYCQECQAWRSNTNHASHGSQGLAKWVPFTEDEAGNSPTKEEAENTYHLQFYEECFRTGRQVLQEALSGFLGSLCADRDDADHRVAIVGYGKGVSYIYSDGSRRLVYNDPDNATDNSPVAGSSTLAKNAWCSVRDVNETTIEEWVSGVAANGGTCTHLGIQAAELAFENAPETEDENRAKVMILFTDGTPGAGYANFGPDSPQGNPDWVTPGIESAQRMKADGVTIYSVGLFPDADGYNAKNISYDVTADGKDNPQFYQNSNCFLHLVSSNYPDATGIDDWGSLNREYVEGMNSYYLGTENAEELDDIFNQIAENVKPGTPAVTLDETAIVKDKITRDFQITYTGESPNVTAYTMSYNGEGKEWTEDEDSVSTTTEGKLHITVDEQTETVSVTNFDFAQNFVHMDENGEPAGKKLVVEILIKPTDETSGGTKLPTNATSADRTDNAGIYGQDTDTPVAEFPLPHVDLPTTVTIQKVVERSGTTEKFSFEATYVEAGDYEDITAEKSGGANDSNYLHFKEGTEKTVDGEFELGDGEKQTLKNVELGSSLTISEEAGDDWVTTVTTSMGTQALTPDADGNYRITVTPGMVITFTNTYMPKADFAFQKTDADDKGLGGAYFGLYKLECSNPGNHNHDNELLTVDQDGNFTGDYEADSSCWKRVDVGNVISTKETGLVSFEGLDTSVEYRLIEYKAPEGYVLPDGQWRLEYNDEEDEFDITAVNESGTPAFAVSEDGGSFIEGQEVYYRVRNYQPGDLPFTGNTGIRVFLMIGGGLMLFGAAGGTWYYMHHRRLSAVHGRRRRRRR